jgi:heavy metal sensor kinase
MILAKRHDLLDSLDARLYAATQAAFRHVEIDAGKLAFDPSDENGTRPSLPRIYRVLDEKGHVLAEALRRRPVPWPPASAGGANPSWTTVRVAEGTTWRIATWVERLEVDAGIAAPANPRGERAFKATVQAAESLSWVRHEQGELVSLLAFLSLAAFLVAGGGSFLLAGRALRPIRRITAALERVSETRLDQRVDPSDFDVELPPLIEQLNEALERLEKGFERERQFTADASHELRTPVTVLLNSIEVLLRRPRTERELAEAHGENWRTARSLQEIIEGLLLLARMDTGKAGPVKASLGLAAVVEDVFSSARAEARAKGVRLESGIAPDFRVAADAAQLRLVLSNLVDNAIRYNRPNGLVKVSARAESAGVIIEVRDTGIGIPAADLEKVFERFYRVDPARAEATGGSGLGLSIVRRIIEAHGGSVRAASGPEGSVFTIVLPAG